MSPGANPSRVTEDLLAEAGFAYTLDWPIDDQPVWLTTRGGPLLSVPYPHEVNDLPVFVHHHQTAETFASMIVDSFEELREDSRRQPLVLSISLHTFLAGQPYRLRRVREALEHLRAHADGVWFTTPGAIAEHYASVVPAPREGSGAGPLQQLEGDAVEDVGLADDQVGRRGGGRRRGSR